MEDNINNNDEYVQPDFSEDEGVGQLPVQEGKHLVKKKRRERLIRKGRIKQERLRGTMKFFISVFLVVLFCYTFNCKGWYMDKNSFNHVGGNSVEIINNKIVSSSKILAILKSTKVPDMPIYLANTNQIRKDILKLSPVENVYIRRYAFPARIQIIVRERTPVIVISPDVKAPPVAFFTSDGKLIGREYLPLASEFKTIKVLSYGNKGDDYQKWNIEKIQRIQKIVKYVELYSKEPVEYIDFRNPNDVFVKVKTVNIRLGRLDETVFKRIERIPSILPQVKLVDSKVKYLDLSWEKVNYLKLQ